MCEELWGLRTLLLGGPIYVLNERGCGCGSGGYRGGGGGVRGVRTPPPPLSDLMMNKIKYQIINESN